MKMNHVTEKTPGPDRGPEPGGKEKHRHANDKLILSKPGAPENPFFNAVLQKLQSAGRKVGPGRGLDVDALVRDAVRLIAGTDDEEIRADQVQRISEVTGVPADWIEDAVEKEGGDA